LELMRYFLVADLVTKFGPNSVGQFYVSLSAARSIAVIFVCV